MPTEQLTARDTTQQHRSPTIKPAGGGNLARSTFTTVVDYGIKKSTGKSSFEHAIGFAEKHNPDRKKKKCVNFLEVTETEVCSILKKRILTAYKRNQSFIYVPSFLAV